MGSRRIVWFAALVALVAVLAPVAPAAPAAPAQTRAQVNEALPAMGHVGDRPVPHSGGGGRGEVHGSRPSMLSVPPVRARCAIAPR
jgi:hypothetical protein